MIKIEDIERSEQLLAKQVMQPLGRGKFTCWPLAHEHKFPAGIKLGNRVTVWKSEDIQAFVDSFTTKEANHD